MRAKRGGLWPVSVSPVAFARTQARGTISQPQLERLAPGGRSRSRWRPSAFRTASPLLAQEVL